jgi:dolichol-phosphate mannosyltransferase
MSKVVVVIPTYNEVKNVLPTTLALSQVFKLVTEHDMHILFVDDNSPDGTAKAISQLMKKYSFVHILNNKRKGGLGHAYKKGFAYAIDKLKADILFEFDADLQHDPQVIPAMLESLSNGADLVLGSRYIKGGGIPENWPWIRKFLSVVGNLYIRVVMGNFRIHDWTTGYRAIRANVVEDIMGMMQNAAFQGYTWQIGFLVKSLQKGYKVTEVPFYFKDRTEGHSKLGPEYIINTMKYIMKVRLSQILHSRILKFVLVGGFGSLIQLIALHFFRILFTSPVGPISAYQIALILAIETAIISNFTWSNLWTFKDRKLKPWQIPLKFLQFNLASGGSLLIQFVIASLGERLIGLFTIFEFYKFSLDTGLLYAVAGILVGMFWNFFAYSHLVWKKK